MSMEKSKLIFKKMIERIRNIEPRKKVGEVDICCNSYGRVAFIGLNVCLAVASFAFIIELLVGLVKYGPFLPGPAVAFCMPCIVTNLLVCGISGFGAWALIKDNWKRLVLYSLGLTLAVVLYLFGSLFLTIVAGGKNFLPNSDVGQKIRVLKRSFEVQVFNNCCVDVLQLDFLTPVNSCSKVPSGSEDVQCIDSDILSQELVNPRLCEELIEQQGESFVGNISGVTCGGDDFLFSEFQDDFRSFYEPKLNPFSVLFNWFYILMIFCWGAGVFQVFFFKTKDERAQLIKGHFLVASIPAKITRYDNVNRAGSSTPSVATSNAMFRQGPEQQQPAFHPHQEPSTEHYSPPPTQPQQPQQVQRQQRFSHDSGNQVHFPQQQHNRYSYSAQTHISQSQRSTSSPSAHFPRAPQQNPNRQSSTNTAPQNLPPTSRLSSPFPPNLPIPPHISQRSNSPNSIQPRRNSEEW